ncbi:Zn-ribbon domain-containing OB-fold protein [Nocardioides sp. SYSU DS0663]|uniref:Zn-ribbon domain-containing OB-fold protein n=1 Tax=Nocardioides sp. SYSU DS0663 TaxID=3416445 RepID=UPI003F4BF8DC
MTAGVIRPMRGRDTEFFWEGTAARELRVQQCRDCEALRFPPGPSCPRCHSFDQSYVVAAGTGTVFSYVVHRHPPVPGKELPIVIALIDLDEGVRMVGEVVDVAGDEIEIGMRLRVDFHRIDDELTLPVWRRPEPVEGRRA